MRFYVAGGCCEYGCNCFLLEGKEYSVLVDCGAGTGGEERPPLLTESRSAGYVICSSPILTETMGDHWTGCGIRDFRVRYI